MSLAAGARLGHYEVLSLLGAGGMGEVYRARDSRLDRDVAIKVLSDRLSHDPEALARFEREAKALAALSHAGIAAIYGLEEANGIRFLVLELVSGASLAMTLQRGPLPLAESLRITGEIAKALEIAHERGILHRDLKPGNVQLTDAGAVKLLDLGLAKVVTPASADLSVALTASAEMGTQEGMILGTPAYMSPEQARGKPVDRRTDIWALGCILYEMLTGQRAFRGDTPSDILASVLTKEPTWSSLPSETPESIRRLLRRCLEKDVDRRLHDVADTLLEIDEARGSVSTLSERRSRYLPVFAAVLATGAIAAVLLSRRGAGLAARLVPLTFAQGVEEFPAFSPDGERIAYSGETGAVRKIFVKTVSGGTEAAITKGDHDDIQPVWSPDGNSILFVRAREAGKRLEPGDLHGQYSGGDIWTYELSSGSERELTQNAFDPAFSPDGNTIAVDASWVGSERIWLVDRNGHNPVQLTSDTSEAVSHIRPRWSPDGRRIVFQNQERTKFDVRVVDIASKQMTFVTNGVFQNVNPVWSGRSIYFSSNRGGGFNVWRLRVKADGTPESPAQQLTLGAGEDIELALSPDGKRLALSMMRQNANIWRLPVAPDTGHATAPPEEMIATTREDSRGAWSPDERVIAFNSDRTGDMNIWLYEIASRATRQITRGPGGDYQPNWSPDGKRIAFFSSRGGSVGVWSVELDSGQLRQLTHGRSVDVNPFFSPDGKKIAYQSDEAGRLDVWVMNADGTEPKQLTQTGVTGHFLRWTADGRSILFRCTCNGQSQSMLVSREGGEPTPLAKVEGGSHMSFSPDGERIMDVLGHKTLFVSPLKGGSPEKVFVFEDAGMRMDYPLWSPDGKYVLFDAFRPRGGGIWLLTGLD